MIIIFGITNERKIEDLRNIIKKLGLDIEIKSLTDISWNRGEIQETRDTFEENSLIKATAIYNFCIDNNISYPILTDDAGLFVESLNGEPGIYTGRYADEELNQNPSLPKYECVNKLLRKLNGISDRRAYYKCVVTCMYSDGTYFQDFGISNGEIVERIVKPLKKPYFYSVFKVINIDKTFNLLNEEELNDSYRYSALNKVLTKVNKTDDIDLFSSYLKCSHCGSGLIIKKSKNQV
jgi:XTP/dITP diphosphohydrolase